MLSVKWTEICYIVLFSNSEKHLPGKVTAGVTDCSLRERNVVIFVTVATVDTAYKRKKKKGGGGAEEI